MNRFKTQVFKSSMAEVTQAGRSNLE